MKKILLFLSLLVFITFTGSGQDLLDPAKKWVNSFGTIGTGGPPPYFIHSNMCRIDTAEFQINGHSYHKLLYTTDSSGIQWQDYGYLRETSEGKVFYIKSLQDTAQRLCYDFSAETATTVTVYNIAHGNYVPFEVLSVDSVFFAGQMRKKITSVMEEWISGVGSSLGFIYNGWQVVGMAYHLNCFFENDVLLYHYEFLPGCFVEYTGIEQHTNDATSICRIIPNPVTDVSTVYFSAEVSRSAGAKFRLLNLVGESVVELPVVTGVVLTRGSFPPGLYFYQVLIENQLITTGKVLVR